MGDVSNPANAGKVGVSAKRASTPEERKLRRHLRNLTRSVMWELAGLDALMKCPATEARGKAIAALANRLDLANDLARSGGLGVTVRGLKRKPVLDFGGLTPDTAAAFRDRINAAPIGTIFAAPPPSVKP